MQVLSASLYILNLVLSHDLQLELKPPSQVKQCVSHTGHIGTKAS